MKKAIETDSVHSRHGQSNGVPRFGLQEREKKNWQACSTIHSFDANRSSLFFAVVSNFGFGFGEESICDDADLEGRLRAVENMNQKSLTKFQALCSYFHQPRALRALCPSLLLSSSATHKLKRYYDEEFTNTITISFDCHNRRRHSRHRQVCSHIDLVLGSSCGQRSITSGNQHPVY